MMKTDIRLLLPLALLGVFVLTISALAYVGSTLNTEISLRTQFEAKQEEATLAYDEMWKVISEQAEVASSYRDSFGDIYTDIIGSRYGSGGGRVMQWVTEQNPDFDTSLMSNLMSSIEAQRMTSRRVQTELLDIRREHTLFVQKFPNRLIVGGRCCLEAQIVTSGRTERSFDTGRDNQVLNFNTAGNGEVQR